MTQFEMNHLRHILCLNSGSSSLKFALYRVAKDDEALLARGAVERIGLDDGRLWFKLARRNLQSAENGVFPNHAAAVEATFARLDGLHLPLPDAIGHRVVHGGAEYSAPAPVDAKLLQTLKQLVSFAPLHLPSEIVCIEAVAAKYPSLPQVACFDTAFHRRMPEITQRFPLPRALWNEGVRRYGFHGLSYEYIMDAVGARPPSRLLIAHLGNGASMAAVQDGIPLDTTMGFTPAGGFMMGTRTGDLDPGILVHLMRERGMDAAQIETLLNNESGLMGVSGISPDMKTLLDERALKPDAAQAVEMFCYHARKTIGALAAALGGLDMFVFTGGIGERAAPVRSMICQGLTHLGIEIDEEKNLTHADTISSAESACVVRVIPTNEDLVIARHTNDLISNN